VNVIHVELFRSIDGGRKRFGVAAGWGGTNIAFLCIFGRRRPLFSGLDVYRNECLLFAIDRQIRPVSMMCRRE
jgi:hypothetical protein